jgi:hypothetical protein
MAGLEALPDTVLEQFRDEARALTFHSTSLTNIGAHERPKVLLCMQQSSQLVEEPFWNPDSSRCRRGFMFELTFNLVQPSPDGGRREMG